MDSIINSIRSLFSTYGFRATAVIVATIILVNLIKKPIISKAKKSQAKTGVDKSVITKNITALPVVVAFALEFIIEMVVSNFNFAVIDFGTVVANAVLYGALAVATYEGVKKQLEAYSAKRNDETALTDAQTTTPNATAPATVVNSENKSQIVFSTND